MEIIALLFRELGSLRLINGMRAETSLRWKMKDMADEVKSAYEEFKRMIQKDTST